MLFLHSLPSEHRQVLARIWQLIRCFKFVPMASGIGDSQRFAPLTVMQFVEIVLIRGGKSKRARCLDTRLSFRLARLSGVTPTNFGSEQMTFGSFFALRASRAK